MAKKLKFNTANDTHAYLPISKSGKLTLFYEAEILHDVEEQENVVRIELELRDGDDQTGETVTAEVPMRNGVTISDIANTLIPKLLSAKRVNDEIKRRVKQVKYLEQQIRALYSIDVQPFVNP